MSVLMLILFFISTSFLTAEEYPIMMQIKTDLKLSEDFRGGVESGLTENGYSLVSEEDQNQTLKEQATQRKKECFDESCLVDVGKMLAAKGLVMVEVVKKGDKSYLFKVKYVDFETGTTQKTVTEYFEYDLSDYKELNKFGKKLIKGMFGKTETTKTKEVVKEVIIKDNTKTETNTEEKYKIEFITTPSNVEVYDSKNNLLGETPFFVSLPKGFTKFSFEKKGFDKVEKEIHVKQNETVEISLNEKIYNLQINTNVEGAKLYIDEKEKGVTPFSAKFKEGIYSIKIEKEEYDSHSEQISLKENFQKTITLNKNIFEIIIKSNVEDSKVYIDGNLKGKAPYTIKLSKGKHKIKLTKDDFGNKEKEFEINKDETISFELYEKGKGGIGEMVIIPNREFKMDATEVTVAQFKECINAGKCIEPSYDRCYIYEGSGLNFGNVSNKFKKDENPVVCIDWAEAESYCKWLGKRLPTKEEWEYAAKGGESYQYAGSDNPDEVAWYNKNSENKTHKVATKKANGYGLYDMSGNVWEWVDEHYLGGGSWCDSIVNVNIDERKGYYLGFRYNDYYYNQEYSFVGFRCVQYVE